MAEHVLPPWLKCHVGTAAAYDYGDFEPAGGGGGGGGATVAKYWDLTTTADQPSEASEDLVFTEGVGLTASIPASSPPGPVTAGVQHAWSLTFDLSSLTLPVDGGVFQWSMGYEMRCTDSNGAAPVSWPAQIPELVDVGALAAGDIMGAMLRPRGLFRDQMMVAAQYNDYRTAYCWSYFPAVIAGKGFYRGAGVEADIDNFRFHASMLWPENAYEVEFRWVQLEVWV